MPETHSRATSGGRAYWYTQRLWELAAGLPAETVPVDSIAELDQDCWFGDTPPTCRAVAEHARRIQDADLAHPIILSSDGRLMDGGHRLARAWLDGQPTITAVRFPTDPPPDYIVPTP
jgi:hypothetical protein